MCPCKMCLMQLAPYALELGQYNMREPTSIMEQFLWIHWHGLTQSVGLIIKLWVDPMVVLKAIRLPAMATSSSIHINESYTA